MPAQEVHTKMRRSITTYPGPKVSQFMQRLFSGCLLSARRIFSCLASRAFAVAMVRYLARAHGAKPEPSTASVREEANNSDGFDLAAVCWRDVD
mmetsp:Transcript_29649/g.76629  ORF Transcript_29649/g.76629 Transcript_29649/m.76629 type:complete len:94 (+) Transcript_29649:1349-1630(+)